jgi:hypothetical protein
VSRHPEDRSPIIAVSLTQAIIIDHGGRVPITLRMQGMQMSMVNRALDDGVVRAPGLQHMRLTRPQGTRTSSERQVHSQTYDNERLGVTGATIMQTPARPTATMSFAQPPPLSNTMEI